MNIEPPNTTETYWDPTGRSIKVKTFADKNNQVEERFEYYKSHPYEPRNRRRIIFGLLCLGAVSGVAGLVLGLEILRGIGGFVFMGGILLLGFYNGRIKSLQKDLIKRVVATQNNWLYNPDRRRSSNTADLQILCPRLFDRGDHQGRYFEDEFWGAFGKSSVERDFYTSIFHYQVESRDKEGKRRMRHYYETVFAVRLGRMLEDELMLLPENGLTRFFQRLGAGNDVQMESEEFNKNFQVIKNGQKDSQSLIEIYKKLTPAMQVSLVDLIRTNPGARIVFMRDVFLFIRPGYLFKKVHTNFFKKVELDVRDEEFLNDRIRELVEVSSEVAKHLR